LACAADIPEEWYEGDQNGLDSFSAGTTSPPWGNSKFDHRILQIEPKPLSELA